MAYNVLVVDDSVVMRSIIIKTLRLSGVGLDYVHEAGNGEEGLAQLRKHWIDFALVDINMPVMDGEEMIDRVRADAEMGDLPIIVVTTESSDTRIESLKNKGVRFIHKPFDPTILRDVVREMTGVANEYQAGDGALPCGGSDF